MNDLPPKVANSRPTCADSTAKINAAAVHVAEPGTKAPNIVGPIALAF
ncbi:MAG TPA: hypothetical protein VKE72_08605 [Methylocella sp.]|nr:hypothetical protein [Methylocella sp.]